MMNLKNNFVYVVIFVWTIFFVFRKCGREHFTVSLAYFYLKKTFEKFDVSNKNQLNNCNSKLQTESEIW